MSLSREFSRQQTFSRIRESRAQRAVNPLRTAPLLLCLAAHFACAEQFPLWDAGFGIGATTLPHYRGSDQSKPSGLPIPYLDFRGEVFKAADRRYRGLPRDTIAPQFILLASTPAN